MSTTTRKELVTKDAILMLLSDDENAKVSMAETAASLKDGDIYIDLDDLAKGVQKASTSGPVMGSVLPRSSVHKDTWNRIMTAMKG